MHIFRMIDMQSPETGILVDMKYNIIDGIEQVIDINVRNIINNIVGEILELADPIYKVTFAANFLTILEQERNNK